ncbi:cytochrome b-c1 complex subunit 7-2-like [Olea europaea var. sylvestris]|uniref:cytochrome b-c1 complex subunit 7-2-like n=1 Tax=Olea europaea var. sylvestris TaxID=158386 RepID=UPI000C1D256B|nr:cytochrome b-c1 complex subunit 7-2-like [Olea europaea var. sylvestris]
MANGLGIGAKRVKYIGLGLLLGLRYDDLYDPMYDLDVKEALNWLPREIVDARNQRLKRAMDLSLKHEYLPEELQVFFLLGNLATNQVSK